MAGDELAWRAEAACRDAWPCDHEIVRNGWLIRASGGATRRTNSINPLSGTRAGIETVLDEARAVYAGRGQSLMVRVPDIAGEMDADFPVQVGGALMIDLGDDGVVGLVGNFRAVDAPRQQ